MSMLNIQHPADVLHLKQITKTLRSDVMIYVGWQLGTYVNGLECVCFLLIGGGLWECNVEDLGGKR